MTTLIQKIKDIDWAEITENMHQNGYAVIPGLLEDEECERLKADYEKAGLYRKRVIMKRYRFGLGEYKYYDYPCPTLFRIYELMSIHIWLQLPIPGLELYR